MKKDIEWLKQEIGTEMIQLEPNRKEKWSDVKYQTLRNVAQKIDQLDEPEVLSQQWIDENIVYADVKGNTEAFLNEHSVRNLLVPKQEEVDLAYKDGYEKGKEYTFYKGYLEGLGDKEKEHETVASVIADFYKSFERFKEVISMEVKE